jgi:putative transposase
MNLTYKFTSKHTNAGKLESIRRLAKMYQSYYNILASKSLHDFYKNGSLPKYLSVLDDFANKNFSEGYKQTCGSQVKSNIDSLRSNIKNRITLAIINSSLSDDTKIILHYINKYRLWFHKSVKIRGTEVPQELMKLSRRLFKQYKGRIPKLRNIIMRLDAKVIKIEKSNNSFDYWIKLTTLDKGHPIHLPIESYHYFENAKGILKKHVQIIVKDTVEYCFVKESEDKELKAESDNDKIVGIDLGMVNLLASSSGNQYGQNLHNKLKRYDEIITRVTKRRQKNGLKNNSAKVDRLYSKVKNLIKNEVGRVLNRFLDREKPDIVVMEDLTGVTQHTTSNKKLSKKMRRMLNNCGMSKIPKRMEIKQKRLGFRLEAVNRAYTSQECPVCHNIDKENRKDQAHFECTQCGYKRNADYVASVNIRNRRSIPAIGIHAPYRSVRGLVERHYVT